MDSWFEDFGCKVCKTDIVPYDGLESSQIIIVGSYPTRDEISEGRPLVPTKGSSGIVLHKELSYLGIHIPSIRYGNFWLHSPNDNEECKQLSIETVIRELVGKKVALIFGKDTIEFFLHEKIDEVNGLIMKSDYFSGVMIPCHTPAKVHFTNVGEVRFALQQFAKYIKENDLE